MTCFIEVLIPMCIKIQQCQYNYLHIRMRIGGGGGGGLDSQKSTSGFALILCSAAVDWDCKKQTAIALSSTEAEYMGATLATQRVIDKARLLGELSEKQIGPVEIRCDNQSTISLAGNPKFHSRSKHIDL